MVALLLSIALAAAPSRAPASPEADRFKALFHAGEKLFAQGEYGLAISQFRQADQLRVTPEVSYDLAKCYEKLGDAAYATYYYRQYLQRAPNASDSLDVASRVGAYLARAEVDGKGLLEVDAFGATSVAVDARAWPDFPVAAFLPPGTHEVVAQFPSGLKKLQVQLRAGKMVSQRFEPVPPPLLEAEGGPTEVSAVPSAGDAAPSATVRSSKKSLMRTSSYVALGVGLLALAGGVTLGILSNNDVATMQAQRNQLTRAQGNALAQSANTKGLVADILFGVGGAAVVAGGVLFVFSWPDPSPQG